MPVARRGRLETRMTPVPAAASYALAPEGPTPLASRLDQHRRERHLRALFDVDAAASAAALAPAIAAFAVGPAAAPGDDEARRYALAPRGVAANEFDPRDTRARRQRVLPGYRTDWVDSAYFRRRAAAVESWALEELAAMAPFATPVVAGYLTALEEDEIDITKEISAAYTPVVEDDGTVWHAVYLNAYSNELEIDLAHEVIHALWRTGRFTAEEWARLTEPNLVRRWTDEQLVAAYADVSPVRLAEEAACTRYASAWRAAAVEGRGALLQLSEAAQEGELAAAAAAAQEIFRAVADGTIGARPEDPEAVRRAFAGLHHDPSGRRFALGGARLHFEAAGLKPVEHAVEDLDQLLMLARERYVLEHTRIFSSHSRTASGPTPAALRWAASSCFGEEQLARL